MNFSGGNETDTCVIESKFLATYDQQNGILDFYFDAKTLKTKQK